MGRIDNRLLVSVNDVVLMCRAAASSVAGLIYGIRPLNERVRNLAGFLRLANYCAEDGRLAAALHGDREKLLVHNVDGEHLTVTVDVVVDPCGYEGLLFRAVIEELRVGSAARTGDI